MAAPARASTVPALPVAQVGRHLGRTGINVAERLLHHLLLTHFQRLLHLIFSHIRVQLRRAWLFVPTPAAHYQGARRARFANRCSSPHVYEKLHTLSV